MDDEKQCPPAGAPAWMATFGDLMSILLTFFILLLSFAEMDQTRFKDAMGSVQTVLGIFSTGPGFFAHTMNPIDFAIDPFAVSSFKGMERYGEQSEGVSKQSDAEKHQTEVYELIKEYVLSKEEQKESSAETLEDYEKDEEKEQKALAELKEEIEKSVNEFYEAVMEKEAQLLASEEEAFRENISLKSELEGIIEELGLEKDVTITASAAGVIMRIKGQVMFDQGKAGLKKKSFPLLKKIGGIVKKHRKSLIVEGHTDNLPLRKGATRYSSNWDLSTARAYSTLKHLSRVDKISTKRASIAGYADTRPIASNATEQGRSKNRRVEFKFYDE